MSTKTTPVDHGESVTTESLIGQLAWELAGRVAARVRWTERASVVFQALGLVCGVALIVVGAVCDPLPTRGVMALGLCQVLLSGLQSLFDRVLSVKDTVQLAATGQKLENEHERASTFQGTLLHRPGKIPSLPSSRRLPGFVGFPVNPTTREKMLMDQLARFRSAEVCNNSSEEV
jgi:hypothetical protein